MSERSMQQLMRDLAFKRANGEVDEPEYQLRLKALREWFPEEPLEAETGSDELVESVVDVSKVSVTRPRPLEDSKLTAGMKVDRFELLEKIGVGGMGQAWKAVDPTKKDEKHAGFVALKFLKPDEQANEQARERSRAAFRVISRLHHSNICPVYELLEDRQFGCFQVMKYVDGITLSQYRKTKADSHGRVSLDRVVKIVTVVSAALQEAHDSNVLHRDIKPENILIEHSGRIQLIDFGLADEMQEETHQSKGLVAGGGTPAYMSPEQLLEEKQTAATDQYSLAVVAWEMLTGSRPFAHKNTRLLLQAMLHNGLPPTDHLSAGVLQVFEKALHPDRKARFDTVRQFAAALKDAASVPVTAPKPDERTAAVKSAPVSPVVTQKSPSPTIATPSPARKPGPTQPALLKAPFDKATAAAAQAAWAKYLGIDVEVTNSVGMKFRVIPPGEFLMGSPDSERDRSNGEAQHRVVITEPKLFGVYPVTQGEWTRVMGSNPSHFSKVKGEDTTRFPVENVSWDDAQTFITKLNAAYAMPKFRYRLPSEAEWEYACRAGTTTPFSFGSDLNVTEANSKGNCFFGISKGPYLKRTSVVGSYSANAFGVYEMHGNVFEWCEDWYLADYYKTSPSDDPRGPNNGSFRVLRGGTWRSSALNCRSAFRLYNGPSGCCSIHGLRLLCELV